MVLNLPNGGSHAIVLHLGLHKIENGALPVGQGIH
jgi:hypothetical protein